MATTGFNITQGFKAKVAMSSAFRFVVYSAKQEVKAPTAATDVPMGIGVSTASTAGDSVDVVLFGLTKIELGATVAGGAHVQINGTGGKAKTLASSGYDAGFLPLQGGDSGEIVPIFLNIIGIPKT